MIEKYEDIHYPVHDVSGVELLRSLMSEQGKPQAEVARELGISPSTISEILSGKRRLRPEVHRGVLTVLLRLAGDVSGSSFKQVRTLRALQPANGTRSVPASGWAGAVPSTS